MLTGVRDLDDAHARFSSWLAARLPAVTALSVSPLSKPGAGLSNETFLLEATWREDGRACRHQLVLRLEPTDFRVFPEYNLAGQVRVMQCLAGTGVPVPHVRWCENDPRVFGCPFYVMDRLEGDIPPEIPPYHAAGWCAEASPARRAALWWSGVDMLARIHALDWRGLGLSFLGVPAGGTDALDRQLAYYDRYLEWVRGDTPQPVLRAALEWLRAHRFEPRRVTLCWGDARLPNMMFRDDVVVGVLDWEMAFIGDPEADLGWWIFLDRCNSEGYGTPRLEGFPDAAATIRRYEQQSGYSVEHAHYYEVFAALRFGVIMARVAGRLQEIGLPTPTPDFARNNSCTQRLAALLGLAPPGEWPWPAWIRR
jgi:aminoglycoside phosphotransferase (APT) family kinase protein